MNSAVKQLLDCFQFVGIQSEVDVGESVSSLLSWLILSNQNTLYNRRFYNFSLRFWLAICMQSPFYRDILD